MPLNPQLFAILQHHFGEVQFANRGEAMRIRPCRRPALRSARLDVEHSGEYYKVCCSFCRDKRFRLWLNHRFGQPHPYTGYPMTWLAVCHNEHCLQKGNNRRILAQRLLTTSTRSAHTPVRIAPGRQVQPRVGHAPPPGTITPVTSLPPTHPAVQYMIGQRRYTAEILDQFGVQYCTEADARFPMAQDRIIFPIWQNGTVAGWQARYVGDVDWRAHGVTKYFTMPGTPIRHLLYNFDVAKDQPCVVVTEGITDVHVVGNAGVALFGHTLSPVQRQKLLTTWNDRPIIFMLDPDARNEMAGIVAGMRRSHRAPVMDVVLPDGYDPGNYSQAELWSIINAIICEQGVELAGSVA